VEEAPADASRVVQSEAFFAATIVSRIRLLFNKDDFRHGLIDLNEVIVGWFALLRGEWQRDTVSIQDGPWRRLTFVVEIAWELQQVMMNIIHERGQMR